MHIPVHFPDVKISIVLLGTLVFFYLYYYIAYSKRIQEKAHSEVTLFITRKLIGFFVLGVIPGTLYYVLLKPVASLKDMFLGSSPSSIIAIIILITIILLVTYLNQKSNPQRNSLQIKITEWNYTLFSINAFGWIIYLLGYEFLFRGILLFECYDNFGFWPAIAFNVVIYSAIHMINSKEEAIGALFFGAIACFFTLWQGTILIPVVMHITLSLSSDYFSIRFNKDLKFVHSKSE